MADTASVRRHRKKQAEHALERLQERYDAAACMDDVWTLRDAAKAAWEAWLARGRTPGVPPILSRPGWDSVEAFLDWHGHRVRVVYVPRHDTLRTVLP